MIKIDPQELADYIDHNCEELKKKAEAEKNATDNEYLKQYFAGMMLAYDQFWRIMTTYVTDKVTADSFEIIETLEKMFK